MSIPSIPLKKQEHDAAKDLTRPASPDSIGALRAILEAAEMEVATDHARVAVAQAHMSYHRPAEALFDPELAKDAGIVSRYSALENMAAAIASAARATINVLLNTARANATTPQLTRR